MNSLCALGGSASSHESHDDVLTDEAVMHGYNFTERVRKVLGMARDEAARLHHEYVGTEHILLGLIREGEGVAAAVLRNLQIDLDDVVESIESHVKKGISTRATGPDLPYTSRAKKVLELAMTEARELGHEYVGTEHLLLGLLREERGVAAQVLKSLGAEVDSVRAETLTLLGTPMPERPDPGARRETSRGRRVIGITIQVDYESGNRSEDRFERVDEAIAFLRGLASSG
jgi:ATP-dependent Clp protease ATP-binding subunit ClpA